MREHRVVRVLIMVARRSSIVIIVLMLLLPSSWTAIVTAHHLRLWVARRHKVIILNCTMAAMRAIIAVASAAT